MRAGIVVNVTRADRRRLEAIVSDRCAPQKHVWRAQIILATADGCGTAEIMRRSGKAKPVVWTWQARFMAEGVDGLLRDKTRKPGKAPLPAETVQLVIDLVTGPPPGEATHWTGRMPAVFRPHPVVLEQLPGRREGVLVLFRVVLEPGSAMPRSARRRCSEVGTKFGFADYLLRS